MIRNLATLGLNGNPDNNGDERLSTDLSMNVLIKGLEMPSRVNLAISMAVNKDAGIPNALSNIWTVKGATLVPAVVERKCC